MSGPANLDQQLDAYLAIREAVGLTNKSRYRLLRDFVAYVQNARVTADSPIRAATAVTWAWDCAPALAASEGEPTASWSSAAFSLSSPASYREPRFQPSRIVAGATRRRPYIFSDEKWGA
jgi:hypothetical protein